MLITVVNKNEIRISNSVVRLHPNAYEIISVNYQYDVEETTKDDERRRRAETMKIFQMNPLS